MANNYTQFSEEITKITPEEKEWLERQIDGRALDRAREKLEEKYVQELPDEIPKEDLQQDGLVLLPNWLEWGSLGFDAEFVHEDPRADPESPKDCFWIWDGEGCGDIEQVGELVQAFLKQFRPRECWPLAFSMSCSKPRIGEFSGGALFVTAEEVEQHTCGEWIEQRRREFKEVSN